MGKLNKNQLDLKTVIFGAGELANNFFKNTKINPSEVVIVDNNYKKIKNKKSGYQVYPPSIVREIKIRKVIIASQDVKNIRNQLINELGIDKKFIEDTPKFFFNNRDNYMIKENLEFMTDFTITFLQEINKSAKVMIDMGTLLGVCRDGELIHWDSDIDLLANEESFKIIKKEIKNFSKSEKYKISTINSKKTKQFRVIDFEVFKDENTKFNVGIDFFKTTSKGIITPWMKENNIFPSSWFIEPRQIKWCGTEILAPSDPDEYLKLIYGANWQIPDRNFSYNDYNLDR